MDRSFDHLSPEERAVVGDPSDYDWAHPIAPPPAQPREGRSQFSMRIDPLLYGQIASMAAARGVSFSDVVRDALAQAVAGTNAVVPGQVISVGTAARITGIGRSTIWTEPSPVLREPRPVRVPGFEEDEWATTSLAGALL